MASRVLLVAATGWAIVSALACLYIAVTDESVLYAVASIVGLVTIVSCAYLFIRGRVLLASILPVAPITLISVGGSPGAIFLLSVLLIIGAAIAHLFEVQTDKLRANGGRA